jgi:HAD superfamily hydrolase (TIGR01549 family)
MNMNGTKIKALLFDLDGTLIDINLKKFIPGYITLLSNYIKEYIPQRKMIPRLLQASKVLEKNDGTKTNEDAFADYFFPVEGYTREDLEPKFIQFYEEEFYKLEKYVNKKPEARPTVKKAFENEYKVVIATTPLLPETAIRQRLSWGDLGDFDYDLITSYEHISATKPNLLYFEQIAEKINVLPEQCLMVGDENKDMIASKAGCKTFLIRSENTDLEPETPKPDYEGTLSDLKSLI